jgi:hypothetical protein
MKKVSLIWLIVATLISGLVSSFLTGRKVEEKEVQLQEVQKKYDELNVLFDSLHSVTFETGVALGRYEITFEHLKEVNPKTGKEMEDWMSHNTE